MNREAQPKKAAQIPKPEGFTLIEVLVSVLVLGIGLLGMAGLQMAGLRNSTTSSQRIQATMLAYDMADRMRANRLGLRSGSYNQPTPTENTACLGTAGCTPAQMASHDMFEWTSTLAAQLPAGGGIVCVDDTPEDGSAGFADCDPTGTAYAIKIWWDENRSGAPDQIFTMSFQP